MCFQNLWHSSIERDLVSGVYYIERMTLFVIALLLTSDQLTCRRKFLFGAGVTSLFYRDDGTEHFSGNQDRRKIIVCASRRVTGYLQRNSTRLAHTMENYSHSEENRESDWRTLMTGGESRPCASANKEKLTTRATARSSWMACIVFTREHPTIIQRTAD